jgi:hypothetical protein
MFCPHDVFVVHACVIGAPRRIDLASTMALLEQGCCEPKVLISPEYQTNVPVPKKVRSQQ